MERHIATHGSDLHRSQHIRLAERPVPPDMVFENLGTSLARPSRPSVNPKSSKSRHEAPIDLSDSSSEDELDLLSSQHSDVSHHDYKHTTPQLTGYARPSVVYAGLKFKKNKTATTATTSHDKTQTSENSPGSLRPSHSQFTKSTVKQSYSQTNIAQKNDKASNMSRRRSPSRPRENSKTRSTKPSRTDYGVSRPSPSSPTTPQQKPSAIGDQVLPRDRPKPRLKSHTSARMAPSPMPNSRLARTEETRGRTRVRSSKGKEKQSSDEDVEVVKDNKSVLPQKVKAKGRDKPEQGLKPKAFPINLEWLSPPTSSAAASRHRRSSSTDSNHSRLWKKSKKEIDNLLDSPTRHLFEDEGDSISFSLNVDPNKLCPYCDALLPAAPSPLLLSMLKELRKKSSPDPRPSNPLGLMAPLASFISACQRHRFESEILPEAEKKGWPKAIDWEKLTGRIEGMKNVLQALIEDIDDGNGDVKMGATNPDSDEEFDWDIPVDGKELAAPVVAVKGTKASSIFWREVAAEIKKKGTRAVTSVHEQFATFDKTQPGYYGELGSVIIHQTLYNMFPPHSIDPKSVAPLTTSDFVQRILVPEVALRLIMEDNHLFGENGMQDALQILRESSAYGVAMFPEDGGDIVGTGRRRKKQSKNLHVDDDEHFGVGDRIVMERARRRRKELEEEEDRENKMVTAGQETSENEWQPSNASHGRKKKGKIRVSSRQSSADAPGVTARPRPKPRHLTKDSSSMSLIQSSQPGNRSRSRPLTDTNGRRNSWSPTCDEVETTVEFSDSDVGYRATSEDKRRSPSLGGMQRSNGPTRNSTIQYTGEVDVSSDSSTKRQGSSRSHGCTQLDGGATRFTEAVGIEDGENSASKTPRGKRFCYADVYDDETPKAQKVVSQRRNEETRPLERARADKKIRAKGAKSDASLSHKSSQQSIQSDNAWLLDDVDGTYRS